MPTLVEIARQFNQGQKPVTITPLGNGLINDTYLVIDPAAQWVLQRINRQVFPQPQWLMDNLRQLNQHLQQKPPAQVRLNIPNMLLSTSAQAHIIDADGDYWRALAFIPNSISKEQPDNLEDARQIGWALGHFHTLCSDLEPDLLHDTLPGFHITPDYLRGFQQALAVPKHVELDDDAQFCLDYISTHQACAHVLEDAKARGELSLRVMHGDPKVNNFLFDQQSQHIISLIDLDTVKPGLLHYDIGDCLRSCCHQADDSFDFAIAEALLTHYLPEVRTFFTKTDLQYLYAAIELIPFELGLRFFTDYLNGNPYFKVTDPKQNCRRAVQQFKLNQSIRQHQPALEQLTQDLSQKLIPNTRTL